MASDTIRITGARQHNLKNISVEIPREKFVVFTGVSGSGKSSLAFNTLYAEGQRRYVESLSAYARQFLDQLEKPDVDFIEGLSPAIAIEQRTSAPNPRSTIATVTEIYDYLRILYAAVGQPHDPATGEAVTRDSPHEICDFLQNLPERTKIILLAPVAKGGKEVLLPEIERLKRQGFVRARVNGEIEEIDSPPALTDSKKQTLEAVIDRIVVKEDIAARLMDSIETALRWSSDQVLVSILKPDAKRWTNKTFSTSFTNPKTGFTMPELTPKHFSFNSHAGACPHCHGLGNVLLCDPGLIVFDDKLSIAEGTIKTWWARNKKLKIAQDRQIDALIEHYGISRDAPWKNLSAEFKNAFFHGTGSTALKTGWKTGPNTRSVAKPFEGIAVQAERLFETSSSETTKRNVRRFLAPSPCPQCEGRRLKPELLAVTMKFGEHGDLGIHQFTGLTIRGALEAIEHPVIPEKFAAATSDLVREIRNRLSFLNEVGLGYLTLDRESGTLSGGEAQRIRLATQIGSGLAGVLYVLDEPSIGLHQSDNTRLIATLKNLRDLGNSVIVVEHDEETIREADLVLDLGPGAGPLGGEIMAQGTPAQLLRDKNSITGRYLSGALKIQVPKNRVAPNRANLDLIPADSSSSETDSGWLTIHKASHHNLKNVTAAFPLGCLTCVTGVSGSGKSTLIDAVLRRALFRHFYRAKDAPGKHEHISGLHQIDKAIVIDQSAIGRSPRSNPATYVGAFSPIREIFAQLPAARVRGYKSGRFSFNVAGGRCEACKGDGAIKIDMHFLSDVFVTCETCQGRRYNRETLEITYKGNNIHEILELTVDEASRFFARVPAINDKLRPLQKVGLGYLKLGQAATTLSGGEAQRVKLATELAKKSTGRTLYMLDEPTTGLHFADIETLMEVFYQLRNQGNTLIVIEHNLDVIKCADWLIDLGPGGGDEGGRIVAEGTPEKVASASESITSQYLKPLLARD